MLELFCQFAGLRKKPLLYSGLLFEKRRLKTITTATVGGVYNGVLYNDERL